MTGRERADLQRALDAARAALATTRQATRPLGTGPLWDGIAASAAAAVEKLELHAAKLEAQLAEADG